MPRIPISWRGAPVLLAAAFLLAPSPASAWWQYGGPLYQRSFPDMPPPSAFGYNLDEQHPSYYGGIRYREYYSFGRGAGLADFPPPLPNPYGHARPYVIVPPPAVVPPPGLAPVSVDPRAAQLEIRVPADAEVWLEGLKTRQTGPNRLFISPPLIADQDYAYEVKAKWSAEGRPVEQSRSITVRAGQRVRVDFTSGEPDTLPAPKPVPVEKER